MGGGRGEGDQHQHTIFPSAGLAGWLPFGIFLCVKLGEDFEILLRWKRKDLRLLVDHSGVRKFCGDHELSRASAEQDQPRWPVGEEGERADRTAGMT